MSATTPSPAKPSDNALRFRSQPDRPSGTTATVGDFRAAGFDHHAEPLDPGRPADRGRVRAAERFDQPIVSAAGNHSSLRAETIRDELERRVAVIVEAANEARVAGPLHARRIEAGRDLREEVRRFGRQVIVDRRRGVGNRPLLRILGVEDPQRVALEPREAVLRQLNCDAPAKCSTSADAPGVARFRITKRVELQRHALVNVRAP